jgi:molybdopterin-guanine dinucleotide biosynthesis protein A
MWNGEKTIPHHLMERQAGDDEDRRAVSAPLSAAVLAGGRSRRMGADKAFLPLVEGGRPMLALVLDRLRDVADDVMVVANDRERFAEFGARIVPDVHADIGTLGGIHSAVSHATHDHCLVVACDMPFLNPGLLQRMAAEPRDYDVLVPVVPGESRQGVEGGVRQTLHAIYSTRCRPAIEERIRSGKHQVIGFFGAVRVRPLDLAEITRWDPALLSFFNANTPEALAQAATMVRDGEHIQAGNRSCE